MLERCTRGVKLKFTGPRNGWAMRDKTERQKR